MASKGCLFFDVSPELMPKRRFKQVKITADVLATLTKADGMKFQIHSKIPQTAQLARVSMDVMLFGDVILVFYDESFAEVHEFGIIPTFDVDQIPVIEQIYEKES